MDTKTFPVKEGAYEVAGNGSRLPAGSTLEVSPGVQVPHPHAEVNLPGAGDTRLGNTKAITETADGEQRPLADEVKPKSLTVATGAVLVPETVQHAVGGTATAAEQKLAVDPVNRANESQASVEPEAKSDEHKE